MCAYLAFINVVKEHLITTKNSCNRDTYLVRSKLGAIYHVKQYEQQDFWRLNKSVFAREVNTDLLRGEVILMCKYYTFFRDKCQCYRINFTSRVLGLLARKKGKVSTTKKPDSFKSGSNFDLKIKII
jgi:hypothetical protein